MGVVVEPPLGVSDACKLIQIKKSVDARSRNHLVQKYKAAGSKAQISLTEESAYANSPVVSWHHFEML